MLTRSLSVSRARVVNSVLRSSRTQLSLPVLQVISSPSRPLLRFQSSMPDRRSNSRTQYNGNRNAMQKTEVSPDSPWYNLVSAFEDCVFQTLESSRTPIFRVVTRSGSRAPMDHSNPLFWDALNRAMKLYEELLESPELNANMVSRLIHLLHNGLRINRKDRVLLSRKPDYDSSAFSKEVEIFLCDSLRKISDDLLAGKIQIHSYGLMHLLTSFKELMLNEEAVRLWKAGSQKPELETLFMHSRVVGVMLPLLYEEGATFDEIKKLVDISSEVSESIHPNLSIGMIKVSLLAGEGETALETFRKLCEDCKRQVNFGYLVDAHLLFISTSKDLAIANSFFNKAINHEMPYRVKLQVSAVTSFMENIWNETKNFGSVQDVWVKALAFYKEESLGIGIFSSLNKTFLHIFFKNFANDKVEGFKHLSSVIKIYEDIKGIDEPFLNIMLTKCVIWNDSDVIAYMSKNFDLFSIPKTVITYRIFLKVLGSVDNATNEDILQKWYDLMNKEDQSGQRYIANADWAAIRDATLSWTSGKYSKLNTVDPEIKKVEQEKITDGRDILYAKILKTYAPYRRDNKQIAQYTKGMSYFYPNLPKLMEGIRDLDTSDIDIPEYQS